MKNLKKCSAIPMFSFNADLFDCLFTINYSDEGSNNCQRESLVLSHWRDYLQDVENHSVEITFSDIPFFVTGLRKVPPCGLALQLSFLHEPEGKDNVMSTFPMANACACKLPSSNPCIVAVGSCLEHTSELVCSIQGVCCLPGFVSTEELQSFIYCEDSLQPCYLVEIYT